MSVATTTAPVRTARATGSTLLDSLLTAVAELPGREIGKIARRAKVDKGEAGRVLAYAESIGYVRTERVRGKRIYLP